MVYGAGLKLREGMKAMMTGRRKISLGVADKMQVVYNIDI